MLKTFFRSIIGIVILCIIAAIVFVALSWSRIPDFIASKLSDKMKVRVEIDDMHIGWNDIDLQKVIIGNPPRSLLPKAFSGDQILIQAPVTTYFKDQVMIDRIEIHDVYVGIEFDSKSSKKGNWTTIMSNLQSGSKAQEASSDKGVFIKKLLLTNIEIVLAYRKEGTIKNLGTIKKIELDNLSSEKGVPYEQISKIIFNQMLKQIFSIEGLTNMLQDIITNPSNGVDNVLQKFKGLFSELEEMSPSDEPKSVADQQIETDRTLAQDLNEEITEPMLEVELLIEQ